jgi:hypothetical protein
MVALDPGRKAVLGLPGKMYTRQHIGEHTFLAMETLTKRGLESNINWLPVDQVPAMQLTLTKTTGKTSGYKLVAYL